MPAFVASVKFMRAAMQEFGRYTSSVPILVCHPKCAIELVCHRDGSRRNRRCGSPGNYSDPLH